MKPKRKRYLQGLHNFWCPKCNHHDINKYIKAVKRFRLLTKPKFLETPNPHYHWVELMRCSDCKTLYAITNQT